MAHIIINNKEIKRIFSNGKEIFNIYRGSEQLWQNFNGVDLGLPSGTLWADRNLGATNINDYGKKYAWGITNDSGQESWANYMCSNTDCGTQNDPLVKAEVIYKDRDNEWFGDISGREFDAIHKDANDKWRLPTAEEFNELLLYCKTYPIINENKEIIAIKVKGQNGNFITLPFSENIIDEDTNGNTSQLTNYKCGYYWTGTINSGNIKQAYSIVITQGTVAFNQNTGDILYDLEDHEEIRQTTRSNCYESVSSRFRHLAIRPVYASKPNEPTITFETNSLSMYKSESRSLYFEISPEMSTDKKVYFTSSSNDITVTNTGYITVSENATDNSATITATLNNGNSATCQIRISSQKNVSNIILKDKNGNVFAETSVNHISATIDEWSSTWILPTLINSNNTSDGIINKNLKWEVTSGSDKAFIVPLYDMCVGWVDAVPTEYDCHPIKIFGLLAGNATVKITYKNNDNTTVIKYVDVTVNSYSKKCNGHAYIDLGIQGNNCWATENVGAIDYSETGNYYAWGEVTTKDNYSMTYYSPKEGTSGSAVFLAKDISNTEYDVAFTEWEGRWHMPTRNEMIKLSSLNRAHIKIGSYRYVLFMGLNNDNYILLRENGYKHNTSVTKSTYCFYWTSVCKASSASNTSNIGPNMTYFLYSKYGYRFFADAESNHANTLTIASGLGVRPIYTFAAPTITVNNSMNTCTISHTENNVTIYYTTDNTDPATSNTRIEYVNNSSISMENVSILRTVAIDQDGNISKESSTRGASGTMYNAPHINIVERFMPLIDEEDNNYASAILDDLMHNGWGQCYPDALFSPKTTFYGGTHYSVGGCVAHSRSQAMWHYKWPIIRKFLFDEKEYTYKSLNNDSQNQYYNLLGDGSIHYNFGNYIVNETTRFNYNNILPKYFTSDLTESNVGYLVTNVKTIDFNYTSDYYVSKGVQYTYEQAAEWSKFLLDFGQIVPLDWGPFATGGSTPEANRKMERNYQYSRKQFYLYRSYATRKLFEEIIQESFENNMPVTATSTGHAWLISSYDDSTEKYYIQLNEGEVSRSAGTNIDRLVTGKYYSYIPGTSSKSAVSIEIEAGITPNCIKSIKDYFIVYQTTTPSTSTTIDGVRRRETENDAIFKTSGYIREINGSIIKEFINNISFNKSNTQGLCVRGGRFNVWGNAVPDTIYLAICLENNNDEIVKYIKYMKYTPRGTSRMSTAAVFNITDIDIYIDLSDVVAGNYKLTARYSKDDGLTYSEKVLVPDIFDLGPETVNISIDNNGIVTINLTYDSYTNING